MCLRHTSHQQNREVAGRFSEQSGVNAVMALMGRTRRTPRSQLKLTLMLVNASNRNGSFDSTGYFLAAQDAL